MTNTAVNISTGATNLSNVGSYSIAVAGASDHNYDFTYVAGNLVISPKAIFVTVPSQAINSSERPLPYNVTYSGFINGDTDSLITQAAYVRDTAGNYMVPGEYQIIPYGAMIGSNNYTLVYIPSDLIIGSPIPDSVTRNMTMPTSLLRQSDTWQHILGDTGFFSPLNMDGSTYDGYTLVPAKDSIKAGAFIAPISGLSLQVERDLAILLGL